MPQKITRREFIHRTGGAAVSLPLGNILKTTTLLLAGLPASCAHLQFKEEGPVHYPRLAEKKIQSPEHYGLEGSMTGIWAPLYSTKVAIDDYKQKVGKELSIYFLKYQVSTQLPLGIFDHVFYDMKDCAKNNAIPFITYDVRVGEKAPRTITKDIYSGKFDEKIVQSAKDLKKYGDQYGGFFIRTMREMNLQRNPSWGGSAKKFKEAWKHIWNIFEQEGANKYATWVFNPYVGHGWGIADRYNPGEKYYDWFGINGFNPVAHARASSESFYQLFASAYRTIRRKYPDKPIMVAETGCPKVYNKAKWVEKAFHNVKNDFPGIKSIAWWSQFWNSGGTWMDTRIDSSPEALEAFKKEISDPYFLGKIPYR